MEKIQSKNEAIKAITNQLVNNNINVAYCYELLGKHLNANQTIIQDFFKKTEADVNGNKWECEVIPQFTNNANGIGFQIKYLFSVSSIKSADSDSNAFLDKELKAANELIFYPCIKDIINNVNNIHRWNVNTMPDISYNWNMGNIFNDWLFCEEGVTTFKLIFDYDFWHLYRANVGQVIDFEKCKQALIMLYNYRGIADRLLDFYYSDDFGDLETLLIVPIMDEKSNKWDIYTSCPEEIHSWFNSKKWDVAQLQLIAIAENLKVWNHLRLTHIYSVLMNNMEFDQTTYYLFSERTLTDELMKSISELPKVD